ncbi:MAG: type I DNA topoisomerase [Chitinophagaceae bacterium]|nr:MAG: type I DNA topoisomerase [Chitinophagaceae bacterium]
MAKNLLIVESPAKAKTIEKFLGKDFKVVSSYGHIRDLKKDKISVNTEENYAPIYEIPSDKKKLVDSLKKEAKSAETVWLATDEDREGEAISWHLCEILGLEPKETKRIVFHEITDKAIRKAIENPRTINMHLVDAQQARRILDRLVGFELSPVLWRKISMKGGLSAGRVQSVAVRLIVEREREIMDFTPKNNFKLSANFNVKDKSGLEAVMKADASFTFKEEKEAQEYLEKCKPATYEIKTLETKPAKKTPAPPFTTSTLQQEAARKLNFSVSRTMSVAQKLYESGKITYMRTDSVNLSDSAMEEAASVISKDFGDKYVKNRRFKTKSSGAQEAHEAIRPSYISESSAGNSNDEERLYELIWKRTIASQMSDAELERTTAKIEISTTKDMLTAKGEVLKFDGFLKVYLESRDEDSEEESSGILPPLETGQKLDLIEFTATERFTRQPPRYNEASLVKKLEELGIGRPSTYAPTISTIQKRNYVEKKELEGKNRTFTVLRLAGDKIDKKVNNETYGHEKNKLYPTDIGKVVNDFLVQYFDKVMDYGFTAKIEEEFDEIASGQKKWVKMIDVFYKPFHENVKETIENAERATGERELGVDPKTKRPVFARMGKYGPMVQIGQVEDEEKPLFSKMPANFTIDTITLEEALKLFDLPRVLGEYEDKEVTAAIGRFGPYIRHNSLFASLKKDQNPHTITFEEAVKLIEEKKEKDKNKYIATFEEQDIQVLNGPYGPYIKQGRKNFKIPKDTDPKTLTAEDCLEIIKNTPEKKGGRGRAKKK